MNLRLYSDVRLRLMTRRCCPRLVSSSAATSHNINWQHPLSTSKVVVALGKFDAMHIGHKALAIRAAKMEGQPCLLSFSGMADVLGWPKRLPLVAACDRPRVLYSWTDVCQGKTPIQRTLPFAEIRTMSPSEFVSLLANKLGARGVVAGSNYRFGFKAKGDAKALVELGAQYGLDISIEDLVEEPAGLEHQGEGHQISSSTIRELLSKGQVRSVARLMGRCYRLVIGSQSSGDTTSPLDLSVLLQSRCLISLPRSDSGSPPPSDQRLLFGEGEERATLPSSSFLNLAPGPGSYRATLSVVPLSCEEQGVPFLPLDLESGCGMPLRVNVTEVGDICLSQDSLAAAAAAGGRGAKDLCVVIDFISDDV
jgi:hypothetical protein